MRQPYEKQHYIDREDVLAVSLALRSKYLTQGPQLLRFENALSRYCGVKYAVAVSSATAGLHLAYVVVGLGRGDEVITTPNTFVATTNAVLYCGAKPRFADIRLDTYNIDESRIEKCITKRTRAIVPVHFAGHPCEMDAILKIAKRNNLPVIEDAAHALGARYHRRQIGSIGDMTVFSFFPVKPITTGEGGAVLTNNKRYYEQLLLLRNHGFHKDKLGKNVMTRLGYNYRMSEAQAALGVSQLKKLNQFLKKRRQIVGLYNNMLGDIEEIILPTESPHVRSGWHLYIIRVKNPRDRDRLMENLKRKGIGTNFHYPAVYSHPYYRKIGFKKIKLSNEEIYHNSCITLPCYVNMTKEDVKKTTDAIKAFLKTR